MPRRRCVSSRAVLSTVAQLIDSAKPERPIGRRLSSFESNFIQAPYFHNLLHSLTKSQKSPLCFHNLTKCFSRKPFRLITFQNDRGVAPLFPNSNVIHSACGGPSGLPSVTKVKATSHYQPGFILSAKWGYSDEASQSFIHS
jgi:hypothetical protein